MKEYPRVPTLEEIPTDHFQGHVWLQELLDGGQLRFHLRETGVIEFGDSRRRFTDDIPLAYRHAVRHVRDALDREALRDAVTDVESIVFFGEAMHRHRIEYDWHRTPSVLGFDIWDGDDERFLPPDATETVFEKLNLHVVNTIEKERRWRDFHPDASTIPTSAWRDGPAAGLVVRDKTGNRARLTNPAIDHDTMVEPITAAPEAIAEKYVTDGLLQEAVEAVAADLPHIPFDPLFERVVELLLRDMHRRLTHGQTAVTLPEFRAAIAAKTHDWLDHSH